jgi:hypothetical protein
MGAAASSPASSPSPSTDQGTLPWIIQPGTYKWIDDIFNTPLKQWGFILACILSCICCVVLLIVAMSGEPEESFSNYMRDAMRNKLVKLTI